MRRALALVTVLALAPWLIACGGPRQPPFETAPSDSAIQQALIDRVTRAEEPWPVSADANTVTYDRQPTPCSALFSVQSVTVTQQPMSYGAKAYPPYAVAVEATFHATRLAADQGDTSMSGGGDVVDCFNATVSGDWPVGETRTFPATFSITYKGPYWMMSDGDARIPLASGPRRAFTVKSAPPGT